GREVGGLPPGSGLEPQAFAFADGLFGALLGTPESNRRPPDQRSGALPAELVPRRGWGVRSLGTHRAMVSVSAPGGQRNPRRRTRAREPNHGSAGAMKKAPAGEPTGAFVRPEGS